MSHKQSLECIGEHTPLFLKRAVEPVPQVDEQTYVEVTVPHDVEQAVWSSDPPGAPREEEVVATVPRSTEFVQVPQISEQIDEVPGCVILKDTGGVINELKTKKEMLGQIEKKTVVLERASRASPRDRRELQRALDENEAFI